MPAKSSGGVIGYRYHVGMHMVLCLGPIDALLGIIVGERVLWGANGNTITTSSNFQTTGLTSSQDFWISRPDLFGGDQREGGIEGTLSLLMGEPSQPQSSYLQPFFGQFCPAFRGVVSIVLKSVYIGVNPYLKNWKFLVRNTPCADWQPSLARITMSDTHLDANPAHILRDGLTDVDSGLGFPASMIDDVSWSYAAVTLYNEGFGMSLIWDHQSSIEDFLQEILNHINGVIHVSMVTGKFELKLLRADYVVSSLLHLDESNVLAVDSFQRASWGETVNEVTVNYTNRFTSQNLSVTVQDLANMQVQGNRISHTKAYRGIASGDLAARVAQRDLQTFSTPLSRVRLKVNRQAWNLRAGDVFRFSWAKLGIVTTVYRVGRIDYGTLTDGTIMVEAVEDVFALPAAAYSTADAVAYNDTSGIPLPTVYHLLRESTFWDLMGHMGSTNAKAQNPLSAWVGGMASRPSTSALSFNLETSGVSINGPYDNGVSMGYFCPSCTISGMGLAVSSTVTYSNPVDMSRVVVGDLGYIGAEIVTVAAIDTVTSTLTLNRGALDTVPIDQASGRIFFGKLGGINNWEYTDGETVYGHILPSYSQGTLDRSQAAALSVTLQGRHSRPYCPGNVKINNNVYPTSLSKASDWVFTWAHRSRTQQTAYVVLQTEGNIGPETGVTYNLKITTSTGTVVVNQTGLTVATYTVLASTLTAYNGQSLTVSLWATNGTTNRESLQKHTWSIAVTA